VHRGDIDGFFGLFFDNLLQIMLIGTLGPLILGWSPEHIALRILPGVALSVIFGNLFYAYQAIRLEQKTGRTDLTALPYGINTVSLMAFIFLVMGPVYQDTHDPDLAWRVGLFATLLNALLELVGAFGASWLRRQTPRAALLSALAGIAMTFISMGFAFQAFEQPMQGLLPLLFVLVIYSGHIRLPFGLPGGLVAILIGVVISYGLRSSGLIPPLGPVPPLSDLGWHPPLPAISELSSLLGSPLGWKYLAVILPMGILNIIGSLQNLESAEAAGDRYDTQSSLFANGIGSLLAAGFGSAFPTTIYIGHPAWKEMGARTGYSVLNALVMGLLCLSGGYLWVIHWIPMEATLGILVWIGLMIAAQAFRETPRSHAFAICAGFLPTLAAWALLLVNTTLRAGGSTLETALPHFGSDLHLKGVIALSQGFVFSAMIFSAILVHTIERQLDRAGLWCLLAALLSYFGVIHAFRIGPLGVENDFGLGTGQAYALPYAGMAILFWIVARARHNVAP
jgi:AGZA family xanthine/uracil permease-like MFS transporter